MRSRSLPPRRLLGHLAAVALVTILGACVSAPTTITKVPRKQLRQATLDEVLGAYDDYCRGLESLSGSGDLTVGDLRAGKARTVGVRLAASRGGRLYIKGSVAVVTAFEIVSDGVRFWFRLPTKNKVWTGPAQAPPPVEEGEEDEPAPYKALRPGDLALALLPEPLAPTAEDALVLEADSHFFSLALLRLDGGRGLVRRRVWLERETLRLARTRYYDENGDLESESRVMAWKEGAPRRISITRPDDGYVATFILSKLKTNVPIPEQAFEPRIPEGDEIIEVED